MGIPDLGKLVYQAVFGVDHLLGDPERFARELRGEWQEVARRRESQECAKREDARFVQTALQIIHPGRRTARLHLAPTMAAGVDLDDLSDFLVGQRTLDGTPDDYESLWREVVRLARAGILPWSAGELERLGLPGTPPRHTSGYGWAAYRVVNHLSAATTAAWLRSRGLGADL